MLFLPRKKKLKRPLFLKRAFFGGVFISRRCARFSRARFNWIKFSQAPITKGLVWRAPIRDRNQCRSLHCCHNNWMLGSGEWGSLPSSDNALFVSPPPPPPKPSQRGRMLLEGTKAFWETKFWAFESAIFPLGVP